LIATLIGGNGDNMPYSEMFKRKMVQKMTGPTPLSASALSRQVDVPQATLSKWLRNAGAKSSFSYPNTQNRAVQVRPDVTKKSPNDWSPEEKLAAVLEAVSLTDEQLGPFLRRKGLHETHLQQWRIQMLDGLEKNPKRKTKVKSNKVQTKKLKELEKELRRKDKALAETAALLVLKKKVRQIWGDEDDDTSPGSDK
jgi:transposase